MFAASKTASVSGGYQISRSLRFNSADTAYLGRTPASASNQQKWTWSGWVKRTGLGSVTLFGGGTSGSAYTELYYSNDTLFFYNNLNSSAAVGTAGVYRDVSAWYHVVCAVDTTQATASNRIKLYVNGSQPTLTTTTYPAQNTNMHINSASVHSIGVLNYTAGFLEYFNGQMTEINFIDGQQLDPSSFGETNAQTGVWQPKAYSGSYGTNGFYLNFSDNSNTTAATLGKDYSGNGNNWTPNNFSVTAGAGNDSLVDSPTSYGTDTGVGGEVRGNYGTLNPVTGSATLSNGNLVYTSATGAYYATIGTIGVSSGKWYWEMTANGAGQVVGICGVTNRGQVGVYVGSTSDSYGYYGLTGNKLNNASSTAYGSGYTSNDVIGVALDLDAGTLVFYKNNTSQGTAFSSLSGTFLPMASNDSTNAGAGTFNFGQRPFAYTAPSGYKALCTQNLPTPTIGATTATQAGKYFNTVLWSGDDTNPRTITGVGFQPDWVWVKGRNAAVNHFLQDAVRGVTSSDTRSLVSNSTDAETNYYAGSGGVTAFASDGFTTSGGGSNGNLNLSGRTFVAWNWKANGSGSTNTAGSITSTVSANTTSGFSIVTYTGNGTNNATVGHGLGATPSMIIIKQRNAARDWPVYHVGYASAGVNDQAYLNLTNAAVGGIADIKSVGSSTFALDTWVGVNGSGNTYVAYCFAPVAGYSAFGSYTGNGSSDGPFIYTGFRPAYVMVKPSSAAGSWWINDNKRDTYNVNDHRINANTSDAEATAGFTQQDFLSNGFKWRNSDSAWNGSGVTYIYMAFAENPFKYSLAR